MTHPIGMAGIFISYRRADSDGWAGRLRDALRVRFGDLVFQDVDNIADGEIFSDVIDRALNECDVALIIIGPSWGSARDEQGRRRLDLEEDWVRTETAMVLNRKIRVIPVLVGGARLPRADELPEELRSLTRRQAREIRSTSWDSDVSLLANHLAQIVGHHRKRVWLDAVPAVIVASVIGVFAGGRFFGPSSPGPPATESAGVSPAADKAERKAPAIAPATVAEISKPDTAAPIATRGRDAAPARAPETRKAVETPRIGQPAPQVGETRRAAPAKAASAPAESSAPPSKRVEARKSSPPVSAAPEIEGTQAAAAEPPPVRTARRSPAPEVTRSTEARPDADTPTERVSGAPRAATGAASTTVARVVPLSLPNRPATARELRIGDSWTYRLRELAYNKDVATVTHEIRGGDASGISEIVRIGRGGSDAEGSGSQRRLPLEARMFEQRLNQDTSLFEFAPFMTAFADLRPGVTWNKIAAGSGSDDWRLSGKVTGRERVTTPAGTFDAIKAEIQGQRDITFPTTLSVYYETDASRLAYSVWFVPEIGRAVKYDRRNYNRGARLLGHEQYELVSYQLK
ncbi:MAG: TIR domain-containing protein [Burkholderiales bacterium]